MPTTVSLLERELSISLPEQYKSALLAYPFPAGSVGEEMLVSEAEWLLRRNRSDSSTGASGRRHEHRLPGLSDGLFLIGTDGSELRYYLRVNANTDAVMQYDLETHRLSEFSASFSQYLERIRQIDAEVAAREALGEERAQAIPQWKHTVRFYMPVAIALFFVFVVMPLIAIGIRSLYRWMVE